MIDVERILRESGGLLQGHFRLSSGRHSDRYLQLAAPFQHPAVGERLARALAEAVRQAGLRPATVLGPALGAIVPGYELARALGVRFVFCERGDDGRFALRRGFALAPEEPVLICENTLTTGGSALEAVALARAAGARVIGVAVYCDRIPQPAGVFDVPYVALARFDLPSWPPEQCPLCRQGSVPIKPGSRPVGG
jgi:orotate phosphoribosyltransferase